MFIPKNYKVSGNDSIPEGTEVVTCGICGSLFAVPENEVAALTEFTDEDGHVKIYICEDCCEKYAEETPDMDDLSKETEDTINKALGN
jgi:hypothetical protein